MTYKIIDDVIPKKYQDELEDIMIGHGGKSGLEDKPETQFPYYHTFDTLSFNEKRQLENHFEVKPIWQQQFCHMLYWDWKSQSPYFDKIANIFINYGKDLNLRQYDPVRVKTNLLATPQHQYKEGMWNPPHKDSPHKQDVSMIYYVCDSDGDTYLFNECFDKGASFNDDASRARGDGIPKKFTVKKRISPKKGRIVMFKSHNYHASSPPFHHDYRVVINFVLRPADQPVK